MLNLKFDIFHLRCVERPLDYQLTDDSLSVSSIQGTLLLVSSLSGSSLLLLVSNSPSSGNILVTKRSILSPAAAMRGTARQQSKSVVRVWFICKILSKGLRSPDMSAGPPFLIRATKIPRS